MTAESALTPRNGLESSSPTPNAAAEARLDQLVSSKSTPTKRVSFMTTAPEDVQIQSVEEENVEDQESRGNSEERATRLENAKQDPNVRNCILISIVKLSINA